MPASSSTGDIIWKWTNPQTVELSNTPPPVEEGPAGTDAEPVADPVTGKASSDQERALMQQMMASQPSYKDASPKQKRAWRRQLRDFFSEAGDPQSDPHLGIQSLIDSGAIRYNEDGLWVATPHLSQEKGETLIHAADAWADQVGLWRPREDGTAEFDPSNYQPYGQWTKEASEEMKRLGGMFGSMGGDNGR